MSFKRYKRKSRKRGSVSTEDELEIKLIPEAIDNQSLQESIAQLSSVMEEKEIPITPGPTMAVKSTPTGKDLLRLIKEQTHSNEWTTFQDICPQNAYDRCQAARVFSDLLDLCHYKVIRAEQEKPYDEIYIWIR